MERIPVAGPWITDKEVAYVADAVANGWYERAGAYQQRFEAAFAEYVGVRYALSVPHCTAAIHLALAALGVGPGDEVIVPDATWIATAAPIDYLGATAVFADIAADTWCLDPQSFAECITSRTKAVIPVDLYGSMPDMPAVRAIAESRGIAVIEDAAEAIGSAIRGRRAGSFGDVGVFSFHGSKTLVTGEGGMLVTDRKDVFERVAFLRDHGRTPGDVSFASSEIAYKYKMSSMQAALGLAQLERIDELVEKKRQIFRWYFERLGACHQITLNAEPEGVLNSYWMTTAVVAPETGLDQRVLAQRFASRGIDTRPFFPPLSSIPAFRDTSQARIARGRNVTAYEISPRGINLPSALSLTQRQAFQVCDELQEALAEASSQTGDRPPDRRLREECYS